jgi:hypothetical protein
MRTNRKDQALERVRMATQKKQKAVYLFEQSVLEARKIGCSLREIEAVTDISNVAVMNMERRAK